MSKYSRREVIRGILGTVGAAAVGAAAVVIPGLSLKGQELDLPSRAGVPVSETGESLELDNGILRARFRKSALGIEQEYYGKKRGGGWQLLVSSFRPPVPRPAEAAPLYSDINVANEYRLLAGDALQTMKAEKQAVVLLGKVGEHQIKQTVTLQSEADHFHIEVEGELGGSPVRLEYLLSTFVFAGGATPDFVHAPHVKRAPDDIIGDRSFRAPALVIQEGELLAAVVPDMDVLNAKVVFAKDARPAHPPGSELPGSLRQDPATISMPSALDVELKSGMTPLPVFSFGYIDFITEQHVYWRHENSKGAMVRELSSNHLRYGFDLFVNAQAPRYRGYQRVSQYQWERYGTHYMARPRPQAMPFAEYAKLCFPAAFAYRGDTEKSTLRFVTNGPDHLDHLEDVGPWPTWLEFDLEGKPAGGIRATPSSWYSDIQFMGWWNNARDAMGMYRWGKRADGDPTLVDKARRIINLALTAPQKEGIFPAVYRSHEKRWVGTYWKFGPDFNKDWTFPKTWDPSAAPKFWDFNSDFYQTAAASKTGVYLLRYRRFCEDEPRIVPFLRPYGDFLIRHMAENGSVPAWFTGEVQPSTVLSFNSEGGIHLWFLCELYRATQEKKYLEAAQRMAAFLIKEIFPEQKWYDFETFYSCCSRPENFYDSHTGQWPRDTLSMIWAVDGFLALYELTQSPRMLDAAQQVADYLSFFQIVWQPQFLITAYVFGGTCVQNNDGEWLDMRQNYVAEAFMRLAQVAHRQDLYERAVAALRASLTLINDPRHVKNEIFAHAIYPLVEPENVDHAGVPQVNMRSGFDWGEGGGLAAAAEILDQIGGVWIDFKNRTAVGVDGLYVRSFQRTGKRIQLQLDNQLSALPFPFAAAYPIDLKIAGLPAGNYELVVNGEAAQPVDLPSPNGIRIQVRPEWRA